MILLIDNYDSFTYNLYQIFVEYNREVEVIRNDKCTLAELGQQSFQGIVISPGPGRPEDAGICIPLIKHYSGKLPILGICLGHQAIAAAFGGNVIQAPAIIHGKPATIFHQNGLLYETIPSPFRAGRYHSLIVEKSSLPETLIVEAETQEGLIMGLRHRDHLTFGMQFHPESILTPMGPLLCQRFVDICERV